MQQYHALLRDILERGDVQYEPRTEMHIIGRAGHQSEYDLREGFPLVTTKNVPPRLPFEEVLWKARGEDSVKSLVDRNLHFWTANAFDHWLKRTDKTGDFPKHTPEWNAEFERYSERIASDAEFAADAGSLGPVYGYQWRHYSDGKGGEIDQLEKMLEGVKSHSASRYFLMDAWNPAEVHRMALPPCPFWHQFTVYGENLDVHVVQRSADSYLGVPFNIAQDALLTHMVAREAGLTARNLFHTTVNTHIYLGVGERGAFLDEPDNLDNLQRRMLRVERRDDFLEIRDWYLRTAPPETEGNKGKDHMPFVLMQLSKEPRTLPQVELADIPFMDAIHLPSEEIVTVNEYDPHRWKSKAVMAA